MNQYQRFNNIIGWVVFAIASFIYLSTIEPTGSFWDCGEFIAAANKLQVGHPPGAPLFLMLSRIFILFAGNDVRLIPIMVNSLSAIMSAGTILFLFWTITALARKIKIKKGTEPTLDQIIVVMGCGLVGALAYAFTDSFWFSAVEGEVYASSSFFTAIVVWAMFKWEQVADERHAVRWIILIAYLMGLSIGVHLLNLLCIPALGFLYYFKKHKITTGGIIATSAITVTILMIVQYGIIAGFVDFGAQIDLLFVNSYKLPFWSGFVTYSLLLLALIAYGVYYTKKKNKPLWNTALLSFLFLIMGYSSYAQIVVRSLANPPMDENNPENAFTLLSYLNREQYGDRPLFYGQYYNAKMIDQKEGAMNYVGFNGKYVPSGKKITPVYEPENCTIFPRMFSRETQHINAYKEWADIKGDAKPTFGQNLKFFFTYQLGHMYWRYFMWNFVGRQNDIQGHGGIQKGNWISGINGLDAMRLGPQDNLPDSMTSNKARNKFYFLPLILGIIGMIYHFKRHNYAWIVALLFFMTGLAIAIYLNQTPYQPRERDYAYAGSFYAFAMWIGLAVAGIAEFLQGKISAKGGAALATVIGLLAGPIILAKDGWDDHNRSHRYTSRDFAYDYLNSCAPNAVIFTNGDNDTFPLWYIQDVENVRTDVRVINLSLLNTDWYIDQIKRKAYESDPVPFTLTTDKYIQGTRDYMPFYDRKLQGYSDLKEVFDFMTSDDPEAKARTQSGDELNYLPTKKFRIKVDKQAVLKNGVVAPEDSSKIADYIEFEIDKSYVMKADLMILDLIAHNDWSRPIYFAVTVGNENYMNLDDYFQLEGLAYRFVPIKHSKDNDGQTGGVATSQMYNNMVNKFQFGNMADPRVYLDMNNLNMCMNFRNNFSRLAESLLEEGKKDSAVKVLDKCLEVMPDKTVPYNIMMLRIAELYYRSANQNASQDSGAVAMKGDVEQSQNKQNTDKANAIVKRLADIYENDLNYYLSLKGTSYFKSAEREMNQAMAVMNELKRLSNYGKQPALNAEIEKRFKVLEDKYTRN